MKKQSPLPKETKAFICGDCGAVALDQNNICKPAGMVQKGDWCGTQGLRVPDFCHNRVNNLRFKCQNCSQVSVNSELLCEPEQMETPKD